MRLKLYKNNLHNITAENRLLKVCFVFLSVCVVWGWHDVHRMVRDQKTIVVFPDREREIVVSGDCVNDEYLRRFAKWVTFLALNYHPYNFSDQSIDLLKLCTPRFHHLLKDKLLDMEETIKSLKISSSFYLKEIAVNQTDKVITIDGLLFQNAQGSLMTKESGERQVYVIKYKIGNGSVMIDEFLKKEL